MLTIMYAAVTPPNALKSFYQKSKRRRKPAIAYAGTSIGIGNNLKVADGFWKTMRKMRPLKIAIFPS